MRGHWTTDTCREQNRTPKPGADFLFYYFLGKAGIRGQVGRGWEGNQSIGGSDAAQTLTSDQATEAFG